LRSFDSRGQDSGLDLQNCVLSRCATVRAPPVPNFGQLHLPSPPMHLAVLASPSFAVRRGEPTAEEADLPPPDLGEGPGVTRFRFSRPKVQPDIGGEQHHRSGGSCSKSQSRRRLPGLQVHPRFALGVLEADHGAVLRAPRQAARDFGLRPPEPGGSALRARRLADPAADQPPDPGRGAGAPAYGRCRRRRGSRRGHPRTTQGGCPRHTGHAAFTCSAGCPSIEASNH